MTAQDWLRTSLKHTVAPAVRDAGFKGSGTTWRRTNESGDVAIVNVQSSFSSTRENLRCVINLSLAPKPWLDWLAHSLRRAPKNVSESHGLYRQRLHPSTAPKDHDVWWEIASERDAANAADDMVAALDSIGLPLLSRLLSRDQLWKQITEQDLGFVRGPHHAVFFKCAEAILIADDGPSARLDSVLHYLDEHTSERQRASNQLLAQWVRERAVAARPSSQ